jgi:hypothetical protein
MQSTDQARCRAIERQISTDFGRDKLAKALYEVIVDGLSISPRELSAPGDRDWIRGAIAMPIQETMDVALHVLAWRLAQVLERAPDGLNDRLHASHRWAEVGWE